MCGGCFEYDLWLMFVDKGDGSDAETGMSEDDFLIQDEIYKSRLASIKRVSFLHLIVFEPVSLGLGYQCPLFQY